jgi:hypothetical protein
VTVNPRQRISFRYGHGCSFNFNFTLLRLSLPPPNEQARLWHRVQEKIACLSRATSETTIQHPNTLSVRIILPCITGRFELTHRTEKWGWVERLMVILPMIGISCAILHHTFYNALDGRPSIPLREVDMWGFEVDITGWAFIIGNTFSWIVGQIFSWSINIVLVNRFWHLLHDRQFTVREVDDIFDITATFYTKTAIRRATSLIFIAAASFAIGVITIFPPLPLRPPSSRGIQVVTSLR